MYNYFKDNQYKT